MPSFLKTIADKKVSIVRMIHDNVGGFEKGRSLSRIHASDLTKDIEYCPREKALYHLLDKPPAGQYIDTALRVTFDEGWDKQGRVNNDYLRQWIVGNWRCSSCKRTRIWGGFPKSSDCEIKAICNWKYEEPVFSHYVSKATGSLDALVAVRKNKLVYVEVKIMKADTFKTLKMPLAEHRIRTQLYLKIIAESEVVEAKQINTSYAIVLYFCRGYGFKNPDIEEISPFKEFVVKRDDAAVQEFINKAHALTTYKRRPDLGLPYGVCDNMLCKRAKQCKVAKQCFSEEFPAAITWEKDGSPVHDGAVFVADGKKIIDDKN